MNSTRWSIQSSNHHHPLQKEDDNDNDNDVTKHLTCSNSQTTPATLSCLRQLLMGPMVCLFLGLTINIKFAVLSLIYVASAFKPLYIILSTLIMRNNNTKSSSSSSSSSLALPSMLQSTLATHKSLTIQFTMLTICLFVYEKSRVLCIPSSSSNDPDSIHHSAFSMAKKIILFEHSLHLDFEPHLQSLFLSNHIIITIANLYYSIMHFVAPVLVMGHLAVNDLDPTFRHRTSFFISLIIALIIFVQFPTMPPRLLSTYRMQYLQSNNNNSTELFEYEGWSHHDINTLEPYWNTVDTLNQQETIYGKLHKEGGNPYAAMPSMHTGWALWSAWVAIETTLKSQFSNDVKRWVRIGGMWHVILTVFFIMITGNHFWLDAVGGSVCVWFGKVISNRLLDDGVEKGFGGMWKVYVMKLIVSFVNRFKRKRRGACDSDDDDDDDSSGSLIQLSVV